MSPLKSLLNRLKTLKFVILPILEGSWPLILLLAISIVSIFVRFPISLGKDPVKLQLRKSNNFRLVILTNADGNSPPMPELRSRYKYSKFIRLPSSSGIVPVNLLRRKLK